MDAASEIAALKSKFEIECQARSILEEWINTSLKTTLERHHQELKTMQVMYESKILALESKLEKEIETRKKLTSWIKENLGPDLDAHPFKQAVSSISSSARNMKRSSSVGANSAPNETPTASASKPSIGTNSATPPSSKPSSLKIKATGNEKIAKKSPRRPNNPTRKGDEPGYESPWSDESDDEPTTTHSNQFSKAIPSSSTSSSNVAPTAKLSSSSGAVSVKPNDPLKSRIQKLASLESNIIGSDEVTDYTFPPGDATLKPAASRIAYYLVQQNQAKLQYSTPNLHDKVTLFIQKGGKIIFAPLTENDRKKDNFNFAILTYDRLFPICPDGLWRSQVLYLVLQGLKRRLGNTAGLEMPHGARSGFDPYTQQDDPSDPSMQFHHFPAPQTGKDLVAFEAAFGVDKVARFGQDQAGNHLFYFDKTQTKKVNLSDVELASIAKHRKRMRSYFDIYYYGCVKGESQNQAKTGRIVFIAFGSAVPIIIDRLSEVNYRLDLSKVTILALPYSADKLFHKDVKAEDYLQAYSTYASLFTPILEAPPV